MCAAPQHTIGLPYSATEIFRKYYYFYGLVNLGNNLFANCCLLYIVQTLGYDFLFMSSLIASTAQVLIMCAFGQLLQDEVKSMTISDIVGKYVIIMFFLLV